MISEFQDTKTHCANDEFILWRQSNPKGYFLRVFDGKSAQIHFNDCEAYEDFSLMKEKEAIHKADKEIDWEFNPYEEAFTFDKLVCSINPSELIEWAHQNGLKKISTCELCLENGYASIKAGPCVWPYPVPLAGSNKIGSSRGLSVPRSVEGPFSYELALTEASEESESFDPASQKDGRDKVVREIVLRRGQRAFRTRLLQIYGGRCAITKCSVEVILEAAHVTPYLGPDTNKAGNGILLRADLHTLWDLGLIAINPETMKIWVSPDLSESEYENFNNKNPNLPLSPEDFPSTEALKAQWILTGNKIKK
jgi:hypothetical protein